MTRFTVNMEIAAEGPVMAHVAQLPGCVVPAQSREEALSLLRTAISAYYDWLHRHGENQPEPADIELALGEIVERAGLFHPGDRAALFATDERPLSRDELETYLRYARYNRADLLALTEHLPDKLLDWRPDEEHMSIRRILRHVGNSEEWYTSRLADPETLPAEWAADEQLPEFTFLAMSRRTVVARLRELTDEELSRVHFPTAWTSRPDEPWTARKALRRLLEHEQEHIAHVREVLAQWRLHFLAHLAAERAELLQLFLGLDEEALTKRPVFEDYSAAELLAHIGAWDDIHTTRIRYALAGREAEIASLSLAEHNETLHAEQQDWSLAEALAAFLTARQTFLEQYNSASDEAIHRPVTLSADEMTSIRSWGIWRIRHESTHAIDIARWRETDELSRGPGPRALLLAALDASGDEIAALSRLIPSADRDRLPLSADDAWTMRDIVGHITDWEAFAVEVLHAGETLDIGFGGKVQAWNEAHQAIRAGQSWATVWQDYGQTRAELRTLLESYADAELRERLPHRWGQDPSRYGWIASFLEHEREHALWLRARLMPHLPARLTQSVH